MEYSDEELKRWWNGVSKSEQMEILATMIELMYNPAFAISLSKQYETGRPFSAKQIAAIRKWEK